MRTLKTLRSTCEMFHALKRCLRYVLNTVSTDLDRARGIERGTVGALRRVRSAGSINLERA